MYYLSYVWILRSCDVLQRKQCLISSFNFIVSKAITPTTLIPTVYNDRIIGMFTELSSMLVLLVGARVARTKKV